MDFFHNLRWKPGIGDPTLMGWATVLAYALGVYLCWLAARRAGRAPGLAAGSRGMWLLVALLMAFLCINKQLDLQSLFTAIGRRIAWKQGWYEDRREFQKWFVLGLLAFSFLTTLTLAIRYHVFWRGHFLLASGLAFLVTFIAVRAVSFHHFDTILKSKIAGVKLNWFLELTGILFILIAAIRDYRHPRRAPKLQR